MSATVTSKTSSKFETFTSTASNKFVPIPQQLFVCINIGAWKGKAFVDTGASYTQSPWQPPPLDTSQQSLFHTCCYPYLQSPGVLSSLRFGLNFFSSGLQINVADRKYSFKSTPNEEYPFPLGQASCSWKTPSSEKETTHQKFKPDTLDIDH